MSFRSSVRAGKNNIDSGAVVAEMTATAKYSAQTSYGIQSVAKSICAATVQAVYMAGADATKLFGGVARSCAALIPALVEPCLCVGSHSSPSTGPRAQAVVQYIHFERKQSRNLIFGFPAPGSMPLLCWQQSLVVHPFLDCKLARFIMSFAQSFIPNHRAPPHPSSHSHRYLLH